MVIRHLVHSTKRSTVWNCLALRNGNGQFISHFLVTLMSGLTVNHFPCWVITMQACLNLVDRHSLEYHMYNKLWWIHIQPLTECVKMNIFQSKCKQRHLSLHFRRKKAHFEALAWIYFVYVQGLINKDHAIIKSSTCFLLKNIYYDISYFTSDNISSCREFDLKVFAKPAWVVIHDCLSIPKALQ